MDFKKDWPVFAGVAIIFAAFIVYSNASGGVGSTFVPSSSAPTTGSGSTAPAASVDPATVFNDYLNFLLGEQQIQSGQALGEISAFSNSNATFITNAQGAATRNQPPPPQPGSGGNFWNTLVQLGQIAAAYFSAGTSSVASATAASTGL